MGPLEIISEFKQAGLSLPEILTISLTDACNLDCAHCWVEAGPCESAVQVSVENVRQVLNDFVRLGGTGIRLTGGEPLLHSGWLEILRIAEGLNLNKIILQTNGMLFSEADISDLCDLGLGNLQIQISLDGATAESHDLVRGEGAFKQTLKALWQLVGSGFGSQLAIFMTEMRHNLHELPDLFTLAAELEVGSVTSGCLVCCGRAAEDNLIMPPEPAQYLLLIDRFREDEAFRSHYEKIGCVAALEWCSTKNQPSGCCRFIETPYLTPQGLLYPCLMCQAEDYSISDVYGKGLVSALREGIPLWSELQTISRQRVSTLTECQTCHLLSSCAGGCMGRAWGSFGEFMRAEDRCQQRLNISHWSKNP